MVSVKLQTAASAHGADAHGGNDWIDGGAITNVNLKSIDAGNKGDHVRNGIAPTLAGDVSVQDVTVTAGRSDPLLDGGCGNAGHFRTHRPQSLDDGRSISVHREIGSRTYVANKPVAAAA